MNIINLWDSNGTAGTLKYCTALFVFCVALQFQSSEWFTGSFSSGVSKKEVSPRFCFDELQASSNQEVDWKLAGISVNDSISYATSKCPRLTWSHQVRSRDCGVQPFDPFDFISIFRGRTLLFTGDSLSSMSCRSFQDVLKNAGLAANTTNTSYGGIDPFRRRMTFGCQEFQNGIIVCCGWIAFSNARNEIKFANQNMFSTDRGILMDVLQPSDLVIWNFGIHHTRAFGGTPEDLVPLINETLSKWTEKKEHHSLPSIWWKECYAQHFKNGHWVSRRDKKCQDISRLPIENETGIYNEVAEEAVKKFEIPIFRVYKASIPLYIAHNTTGDCTHFCDEDRGPMDHDNALLNSLLHYSIASGSLPELAGGRNETNGFDIQRRWNMLMEHPTDSIIAKMDSCANSKESGKGHTWVEEIHGPIPLVLQQCLERSERLHHI